VAKVFQRSGKPANCHSGHVPEVGVEARLVAGLLGHRERVREPVPLNPAGIVEAITDVFAGVDVRLPFLQFLYAERRSDTEKARRNVPLAENKTP